MVVVILLPLLVVVICEELKYHPYSMTRLWWWYSGYFFLLLSILVIMMMMVRITVIKLNLSLSSILQLLFSDQSFNDMIRLVLVVKHNSVPINNWYTLPLDAFRLVELYSELSNEGSLLRPWHSLRFIRVPSTSVLAHSMVTACPQVWQVLPSTSVLEHSMVPACPQVWQVLPSTSLLTHSMVHSACRIHVSKVTFLNLNASK